MLAPSNMPTGIRNMFTTACSNPWEKNSIVGPQMASIFPEKDVDIRPATDRQADHPVTEHPFGESREEAGGPCDA